MRVLPVIPRVSYRGTNVLRDKCKPEEYIYGEHVKFTKDGYVVGDDTAQKIKIVRVNDGTKTFPDPQGVDDIVKQYKVDLKNPRIREIINDKGLDRK